mmetsp:Transcript_32671/g.68297  ORF Transcript_32671/g.68297 Transcript_32671/m.68297 type:complete len:400 (+) Transcript_32671:202-1401(+)
MPSRCPLRSRRRASGPRCIPAVIARRGPQHSAGVLAVAPASWRCCGPCLERGGGLPSSPRQPPMHPRRTRRRGAARAAKRRGRCPPSLPAGPPLGTDIPALLCGRLLRRRLVERLRHELVGDEEEHQRHRQQRQQAVAHEDEHAQVLELARLRRRHPHRLRDEDADLARHGGAEVGEARQQRKRRRLQPLLHQLGGEDDCGHEGDGSDGRPDDGVPEHVERLVRDADGDVPAVDDEEVEAGRHDLQDGGDEEDIPEGPPGEEGLEQDDADPRHHGAHNGRVRVVVGVVERRTARHARRVRREPEVLRAGDAHVEHAGDEHVEVAAGHLTREPDEGEDGDEGCAREAEAELKQVVVEEEVVDHGVAEGNQGHQDAKSHKLPVLLEHADLQTTTFLRNLRV